jgi:DNA-binding CsgD family transcriptional regulator
VELLLTPSSATAIGEICRRLEGLPLAIELAAAHANVLSPEAILTRLDRPLDLLVTGRRDQSPRHQTLRAGIGWSYSLLDPAARALFRCMAVFPGGCDLEAVEALSDVTTRASVLARVESLVEHGLVQATGGGPHGPRFQMLLTIREFALEQLTEAGDVTATRDRHARYYLAVAEEAEPHLVRSAVPDWLERLDLELDNWRAALTWFLDNASADCGLRLVWALRAFWLARGYAAEADTWLSRFLTLSGPASTARARGQAFACMAAYYVGAHPRALRLGTAAVELATSLGDNQALAYAHQALGTAARERAEYEVALEHLAHAETAGRTLGDAAFMGAVIFEQAFASAFAGQLKDAEALARRAQTLFESIGSTRGRSSVDGLMGRVNYLRGDLHRARTHLERAVETATASGQTGAHTASVLAMLARVEIAAGRLQHAGSIVEVCLRMAARHQNLMIVARTLDAAACLAAAEGRAEQAVRLAGAVSALRESAGLRSPPNIDQTTQRELRAARLKLEPRFAQMAWRAGRQLGWEDAVREALLAPQRKPLRDPHITARTRLSAREQQVAELLTEGLSNQEIARELGISERTVEHHVSHILDKLGLTTRTQVAAWTATRRQSQAIGA